MEGDGRAVRRWGRPLRQERGEAIPDGNYVGELGGDVLKFEETAYEIHHLCLMDFFLTFKERCFLLCGLDIVTPCSTRQAIDCWFVIEFSSKIQVPRNRFNMDPCWRAPHAHVFNGKLVDS